MSEGFEKLVHNERMKLGATLVNSVAIACVVAGVVTPIAALTYGLSAAPGQDARTVTITCVAWLAVAGALHYFARVVIGRLRE